MDSNTLGRASRSTKSINVEANLLAERLAERSRIAESSRRKLVVLVGATLLCIVAGPSLVRYQSEAARTQGKAQVRADQMSKRRTELEQQVEEAQPKLKESELMGGLRGQSEGVLQQLTGLLNAVPAGVALNGVKLDVVGGAMTFQCSAEAESFEQAQAFLANVRSEPGSKDAFLSSARQSALISPTGVGFDLIKKVEWHP